jgi:exopolysaccharide biosynthesis polyprenyl glycosylphosphotransferase
LLLSIQLGAGTIVCFLGLSAGYWLRFHTPLRHIGVELDHPYVAYLPLLIFGTLCMVGSFAYLKLYVPRLLLRPQEAGAIMVRGIFFWFLFFLSASLILKFNPSVSRLFVAISCLTTLMAMMTWRYVFYFVLSRSRWRKRIMQRVVLVGWNEEAARVVQAISNDKTSAYEICGLITVDGTPDPTAAGVTLLGSLDDFEPIVRRHLVDTVVVTDLSLERDRLLDLASECERLYVAFKIIPSFFQIFVSSLRMQTISGVPILGVEELAINGVINHLLKRAVDIVGALVGLAGSVPIMGVLAVLIRREDSGPVFYRQVRVGLHGHSFTIYKLRSMRTDAESSTGACWAVPGDERRLKVGAFMREWNLDELPQFWNILKGEMSLVGPRPERPELIAQFEKEIPHYNPRHEVRPGLTGWAQVNGLRGNTSLHERIRYDLYYIENWSLWLDVQILIFTFFRRQNAY